MALAINKSNHLFTSTLIDGKVYRSTDNGENWVELTNWPTDAYVRIFALNSSDHIFAVAWGDGIFKSTDNGENWIAINNGLTDLSVSSLEIDSSGYILAGTLGGGIFRSINPITSVEDQNSFTPEIFSLSQNYPNPFNPSTKIKFQIPDQVRNDNRLVTLKVYDVLGNEIATLVNEEKQPGVYEVEFSIHSDEGRNLSSGIYFYQLKVRGPEINSGQGFIETKKMVLIK